MKGDVVLVSPSYGGGGYINYRSRISMQQHIANDPALPCRNYDEDYWYAKCLQDRYISQVESVLGCIPPWLADNSSA